MHLHLWNKGPTKALPALLLTAAIALAVTGGAGALYILTGADSSAVVLDGGAQPAVEHKLIDLRSGTLGHDALITADTPVYVEHDGSVTVLQSTGETVSSLLARADALPGTLEMVGVDLSSDSVTLTVADHLTCYEQVTEEVAFSVTYIPSADLPKGTEQVLRAGVDGEHTCVYEQVWSNGVLASRQMVEELSTTAVEELRSCGTAVDTVSRSDTLVSAANGVLTFASGDTMKYAQVRDMTATAYTAGHGGADYTTATGTIVEIGVVAVDKRVIPLGTRMYIVTDSGYVYGVAVAEDTGVRGDVVDLYMNTYNDCMNFGRQGCTVYILE